METFRRHLTAIYLGLAVLILVAAIGTAAFRSSANAEVNAAPDANSPQRIAYVDGGLKTMAGSGTVVAGQWKCNLGGNSIYGAEVQYTAPVLGTSSTLDFLWQQTWDRGTTVANVGSWTQANAATTTPVTQKQMVADIVGSTAVAYGECFRFNYTLSGSGTVTAGFKVNGIAK